jgi:protein-L-isoaspartate(D-aspartate) O-methyltransferase
MAKYPREFFVPKNVLSMAYRDSPLPIGCEQTISQPYTVIFMLELLQAWEGDVFFEIGSGSCWQTAMLSFIVGDKGKVFACELNKEIYNFGENNLRIIKGAKPLC